MPEATGTTSVECECPNCGCVFTEEDVEVTVEFDMGDYAPDHSWRD